MSLRNHFFFTKKRSQNLNSHNEMRLGLFTMSYKYSCLSEVETFGSAFVLAVQHVFLRFAEVVASDLHSPFSQS